MTFLIPEKRGYLFLFYKAPRTPSRRISRHFTLIQAARLTPSSEL